MMMTILLTILFLTIVPYGIYRLLFIEVSEGTTKLFLFFGKLRKNLNKPGIYFEFLKVMPGAQILEVSNKLQGKIIENQVVHDKNGTMLIVNLWCEYRVVNSEKAAIAVEDWEEAFQTALIHSTLQVLCSMSYIELIRMGNELKREVNQMLKPDLAFWGLQLENLEIQNIQLTPEVTKPIFESLSARLEVAKAAIEEDGRQRVQLLEAQTQKSVATLLTQAKAKKPLAVGKALSELKSTPEVLNGYLELYRLQKINPRNTIAFTGFQDGEIRELDAAMVHPSSLASENSKEITKDASALVGQSNMAN